MADCDLAIVGSGFGGSLLSMVAARLGQRVLLLERGSHPRFAIGESASPLAGVLIEQLADRYDLPRVRPLSAFGTWQRAYPELGCGLKRGFTYFHHAERQPYRAAPDRANQLLVAASPDDELSDTHWLRADVDDFLVREAAALGVDYADHVQLDRLDAGPAGGWTLSGVRRGQPFAARARCIVDASGPNGVLSRALNIPNAGFAGYPQTQALFSHFTGVARCDNRPEFGCGGAKERGGEGAEPPYPADDAALHHVFDGGWMWVLRFGNGVTSAGVAVTDELAADLRLADGEPAWRRLLGRFPSIAAQFADAVPLRAFTWMPRLAWRAAAAAGPGWAMLPSAAAFVDPLFSTGFPLTLLGIERLARMLEGAPEGPPLQPGPPLDAYGAITLAEADHTARFIAGCYAAFPRFDQFAAYSMFYFAAASFSEMARRLDPAHAPAGFLGLHDKPFRQAMGQLSPALAPAQEGYADDVARAIAHLNIAGLCDARKRNWYGIDLQDVVRGAGKLGMTQADLKVRLYDLLPTTY